jgi:hypothetical protein
MRLHAGIDLHANNSVVVVIDEDDRILYQKRLHNELKYCCKRWHPTRTCYRALSWNRPTIGIGSSMG